MWFFFFFSLVLKEEASDYLELDTVKNLVKKYSQFINFPIYVWSSKVSVFNWVSCSMCFDCEKCLARYFRKDEAMLWNLGVFNFQNYSIPYTSG